FFPILSSVRALHNIYTLSLHDALPISECKGRTKDNFSMYLVKIKVIGSREKSAFDTLPTRKEPKGRVARRLFSSKSGRSRWLRRSEEHTSELQSRENLVCRLLLEKKKL